MLAGSVEVITAFRVCMVGIMKTVIFDVQSPEETAANIKSLWTSDKPETAARISFATPELLFSVLSAERWVLLKVLLGAGPVSIQETARRAGRDVAAVYKDVKALLNAGVLDQAGGSIWFPFDRVKVEFLLEAPPADELMGALRQRRLPR